MSSALGSRPPGMTELRAHNVSISLDGYAAGPAQDLAQPLGIGGEQLHEWWKDLPPPTARTLAAGP
ncbi:MAG: Dihydrofolate reductase homolog [uncultured Blastococcus sp.]|uniref:Dihydrofolate reductase homolog n=1 Tax=uncultured Blastococcus sp. TaxID=217144 RepID=A0A6J4JGM4_9ACTN|nr:MAG: Dihydrofolate reductase homolog [uncultured Blastococcus sp.]